MRVLTVRGRGGMTRVAARRRSNGTRAALCAMALALAGSCEAFVSFDGFDFGAGGESAAGGGTAAGGGLSSGGGGVGGDMSVGGGVGGGGHGQAGAGAQGACGGNDGGLHPPTCEDETPGPGAGCPAPCTSCPEPGLCVVACTQNDCEGQAVVCPAGFACDVTCNFAQACRQTTLTCPADHACSISCNGNRACESLSMDCRGSGSCDISCRDHPDVCAAAVVECGAMSCEGYCQLVQDPQDLPDIRCNDSCGCERCCG